MQLLKERNFSLFYFGSLVSYIGSMLCNFATSLFILDLSGSAIMMSLFLAYTTIIQLVLTPIMGAYSDRFSKKKCIVVCDFLFGITDLALAIILFMGVSNTYIWIAVIANATINTIVSSMAQPASSSIIPLIVHKDKLQKAYSLFSVLFDLTSIIGVISGATLYAIFGYKILLVINAATFIFASICELFIKVHEEKAEVKEKTDFMQEVKEGFTYLYERKELLAVAKCSVLINVCLTGIFAISIPYLINTHFDLHPMVLAVTSVGLSVGSIIGALIYGEKLIKKVSMAIQIGFTRLIFISIIFIVAYFLMQGGYIHWTLFSGLLFMGSLSLGFNGAYIQLPLNVSYAKRVDSNFMGRVMAIRSTLATVASPLAMVVAGILIEYLGVISVFISCTCLIVFAAIYTIRNKALKGLDD